MIIEPTVGRIVWFWPGGSQSGLLSILDTQPMMARVCYVHSPRVINVVVTDHVGREHAFAGVGLRQEGDAPVDPGFAYCEWMPYQKGQAAKTDSLAKLLDLQEDRPLPAGGNFGGLGGQGALK